MFFDITVPLIAPAIASGTLLAFAMSLDDVVISFFVTGRRSTPCRCRSTQCSRWASPEVNALYTVMLGAVFLVVAITRLARIRRKAEP